MWVNSLFKEKLSEDAIIHLRQIIWPKLSEVNFEKFKHNLDILKLETYWLSDLNYPGCFRIRNPRTPRIARTLMASIRCALAAWWSSVSFCTPPGRHLFILNFNKRSTWGVQQLSNLSEKVRDFRKTGTFQKIRTITLSLPLVHLCGKHSHENHFILLK